MLSISRRRERDPSAHIRENLAKEDAQHEEDSKEESSEESKEETQITLTANAARASPTAFRNHRRRRR